MNIEFSDNFKTCLPTFDDNIRQAVLIFVAHVRQNGLRGLQGRNKSSAPQNPRTKKERANFDYAQKHCLWHYHIGIPYYVGEFGDMTSEYILHYQKFDDEIILIDIAIHPPFILPTLEKLI